MGDEAADQGGWGGGDVGGQGGGSAEQESGPREAAGGVAVPASDEHVERGDEHHAVDRSRALAAYAASSAWDDECRRDQRFKGARSSALKLISTVGRPCLAIVALPGCLTWQSRLTPKIPDQPEYISGTALQDTSAGHLRLPLATSEPHDPDPTSAGRDDRHQLARPI